MARPSTFGIEEENLLVDLETGRVIVAPSLAVTRCCRDALGPWFAEEMFLSQVEIVSPVFDTLHQAGGFFTEQRHCLSQALAEEGVGLYCAASHPSAQWLRQRPRDSSHFRQLFSDYRMVAQRSLLNGLHVHVGVPNGVDRMQVINRVLYWLPLLLTLSTSSAYWGGQDTGYMSYRRVVCAEWPHMGLPESLPDWNAYERYRALLQRTGSLAENGDFWWAIRPSRRFPTVELRICDGCPRLDDALAVAGLFRHLVERALNRSHGLAGPEMRWVTQENYWRALRHGRHATFIGIHEQQPVSAEAWLAQLQMQCPADTADAERAFTRARRILRDGTSADRQRAAYAQAREDGLDDRHAMRSVVEQVIAEHLSGGGSA
ncbi:MULTISPECIES: carboxylate-amine ligase [unclassified Pseudomonas]|uniref:carboxylate-amine ligase n=1 Tax=unclassified Pseudomonas TaxID=196821 RepID=UPI0035C0741D